VSAITAKDTYEIQFDYPDNYWLYRVYREVEDKGALIDGTAVYIPLAILTPDDLELLRKTIDEALRQRAKRGEAEA
jgi:hypothetical protein